MASYRRLAVIILLAAGLLAPSPLQPVRAAAPTSASSGFLGRAIELLHVGSPSLRIEQLDAPLRNARGSGSAWRFSTAAGTVGLAGVVHALTEASDELGATPELAAPMLFTALPSSPGNYDVTVWQFETTDPASAPKALGSYTASAGDEPDGTDWVGLTCTAMGFLPVAYNYTVYLGLACLYTQYGHVVSNAWYYDGSPRGVTTRVSNTTTGSYEQQVLAYFRTTADGSCWLDYDPSVSTTGGSCHYRKGDGTFPDNKVYHRVWIDWPDGITTVNVMSTYEIRITNFFLDWGRRYIVMDRPGTYIVRVGIDTGSVHHPADAGPGFSGYTPTGWLLHKIVAA